jgi:hypothetical protein
MAQLATLVNALPALNALAFDIRVVANPHGLPGVDPPSLGLRLAHLDLRGVADSELLDELKE